MGISFRKRKTSEMGHATPGTRAGGAYFGNYIKGRAMPNLHRVLRPPYPRLPIQSPLSTPFLKRDPHDQPALTSIKLGRGVMSMARAYHWSWTAGGRLGILFMMAWILWGSGGSIPYAVAQDRPPGAEGFLKKPGQAASKTAGARSFEKGGIAPYKPGELLVRYKTAASESSVVSRHKGTVSKTIRKYRRIRVNRVKLFEGTDVNRALESLRKDPDVEHVEPNYQHQTCLLPNDAYFGELWGLHNLGQAVYGSAGTQDADIDAPEAWDITSGATVVVVAVVDSGVFLTHPDLSRNLWSNPGEIPGNGIDDDGNGKVDDVTGWDFVQEDNDPKDLHGHGTHVAGIIAGEGNNAIGVAGVSWNAKIMALRGLDASGVGLTSDLIEAIEYAGDNGAQIINCSWGSQSNSRFLREAICASPALVVCAAGNDGTNNDSAPFYPAGYNCPNIISVAATDQSDSLASFSNYGAASVHVGAPGVRILSTVFSGDQPAYAHYNGTSMAAPHVSGTAALVLAQNPSLTPAQVKSAIEGSVDAKPALSGKVATGGRVNVFKALPPTAPAGLSVTRIAGADLTLSWTDKSANESGFKIERKGVGGTWGEIGSVSENVTTYVDYGGGQSDVQYRILAFNGAADSGYSNTLTFQKGPPTATLSYDDPNIQHVDVGELVITATFSEVLAGAVQITIDRPGSMSDVQGAMSGSENVWTYHLSISRQNGGAVVDGPYTVSLAAQDLEGNSVGEVKNNQFITDTRDTDGDGTRDFNDTDDDNDGLPDEWEVRFGLNDQNADGASGWDGDFDGDGWANWEEYRDNTDPSNPASPAPNPPVIREVNPASLSGVTNEVLIPRNTAFAVRFHSPNRIPLNGSSGVTLTIDDGVTTYTRSLNERSASGVTLVQAVPLDSGRTNSEKCWVVYYRANESGLTPFYPHAAVIGVSVYATDIRNDSMLPTAFRFKIEGVTDYLRGEEERPKTTVTSSSGVTKVEVSEGTLRGAAILYDESVGGTGVTPYFGPSSEIPGLSVSGANGVGAVLNLKPPTVFPEGVTLRIPAPGYYGCRRSWPLLLQR